MCIYIYTHIYEYIHFRITKGKEILRGRSIAQYILSFELILLR